MQCYWVKCTEYEIEPLRRATKSVAVLPLASIESHGPHLPLGSDPLVLEHVVGRVVGVEPVAVLPTLYYSFVAEARMLPGAIHTPSHLLMDQVEVICDEVHRNGFDKVVLLHGHGGNVALHWMFCKRVLEREKPYAVYSIPVFGSKGAEIAGMFKSNTGHACEMETSTNLVVHPELVNLPALGKKTFPTNPSPQVGAAHTPVEWVSRYPEMAVGEPQRATREKGEAVLQLWAQEIVDILRKIKADQVTLSEMRRYTRQARGLRPGGGGGVGSRRGKKPGGRAAAKRKRTR